MNPDTPQSPRDELEMRLTALLLGQLTDDEAKALQQTMSTDLELQRLHDRLQQTIGLVREAATSPNDGDRPPVEQLKLSTERRDQLLASFKTVRPAQLARLEQRRVQRRELAMVAAMIVGLMLAAGLFFATLESSKTQQWSEARAEWVATRPESDFGDVNLAVPPASSSEPRTKRKVLGFFAKETDRKSGVEGELVKAQAGDQVLHYDTVASVPAPASPPVEIAEAGRAGVGVQGGSPPSASEFRSIPSRPAGVVEFSPDGTRLASRLPAGGFAGGGGGGRGGGGPAKKDGEAATAAATASTTDAELAAETALGRAVSDSLARVDQSGVYAAGTTPQNPSGPRPKVASAGAGSGQRRSQIVLPESRDELAEHVSLGDLVAPKPSNTSGMGAVAAAGVGGTIQLWSADTGRPVGEPLQAQSRIWHSNLSPDSQRVASAPGNAPTVGLDSTAPTFAYAVKPETKPEGIIVQTPTVDPATGLPLPPAAQSIPPPAVDGAVTLDKPAPVLGGLFGAATKPEYAGVNLAGQMVAPGQVPAQPSDTQLAISERKRRDALKSESRAREDAKQQLGVQVEFMESKDKVDQKLEPSLEKKRESERIDGIQNAPVADQSQLQDQLRAQLGEANDQLSQWRSTMAQPTVIPEITYPTVATNAAAILSFNSDAQPAQTPAGVPFTENSAWRETMDQNLPKDTTVTIVDQAEASSRERSLWGTIRGALSKDTEATARVAVQKNEVGIAGLSAANTAQRFDPYWVQTEFEKLKSNLVLNEVAEQLKLNETWAGRYGKGQSLPPEETTRRLREMINIRQESKSGVFDIQVKGASSEESAQIANTVAKVYQEQKQRQQEQLNQEGRRTLSARLKQVSDRPEAEQQKLAKNITAEAPKKITEESDTPAPRKPATNAPVPQPEVATVDQPYSTFSLNVSDVSFKLAAASLDKGQLPDPSTVRTEEFINAFDYRDPEPVGRQRLAFHWERARYPFAHNRDLVRLSVKTAASGRQAGRPLNVVLLLDNSGSMERADRQRIRQECLRVLAAQLQPQDRVSVVAFARTPRLWVDGLPGSQAGELPQRVGQLTPDGGTNLEEAMNLAYQTARRHFQTHGINRVVLLTDGAANLGDVEPASLKRSVESNRQQGVALDCFGLGWDGYNDNLLEVLSRNGDGRYGFINTPEAAATEFAGQLAGALRVAASDVKVQVQFNPRRVTTYRQMGYAKHQLTKEQFRDNKVDAAEIGAAEAGNALYIVEVNPNGEGPLGVARVRFKVPGTQDYREHEWTLAYDGSAKVFEQAAPSLRLAGVSAAFSEWLVASPFAAEVTPSRLLGYLGGVPQLSAADPRPKQLETMLRQAGSISAK